MPKQQCLQKWLFTGMRVLSRHAATTPGMQAVILMGCNAVHVTVAQERRDRCSSKDGGRTSSRAAAKSLPVRLQAFLNRSHAALMSSSKAARPSSRLPYTPALDDARLKTRSMAAARPASC